MLIGANPTKPNWETFRGNNHHLIDSGGVRNLGSVSFSRHLMKPLSDDLWFDLVARMNITSLRIYRHDQEEWTDGNHRGHVTIYLNEKEEVKDIKFVP